MVAAFPSFLLLFPFLLFYSVSYSALFCLLLLNKLNKQIIVEKIKLQQQEDYGGCISPFPLSEH